MQKLHRINKEKDFWGGHRKNIRKIDCRQSQITPLSQLCGLVCGFRRKGKETPPVPMPAPVGLFLRGFWKGGVFESVWVIRG